MGCGISRLDPKEAVEATANVPHNPPPPHHSTTKSTTSNCFTGLSKPNPPEDRPFPKPHAHQHSSSLDPDKIVVPMNTMQREVKELKDRDHRRDLTNDHEEDDEHGREICRGGSPSFREYCIDSDSKSKSMRSEDNGECEGGHCKWPIELTLHSEKEEELENEIEKRERIGKGTRKALHRGKSGGVRNFLSASRRQQQQNTNNFQVHDNSHKRLLAKAS